MQGNIHKILIVKLCCIGDVVFITPLIRALHSAFPEAKIGFMASSWIKDVVERIPFIDEVIFYDSPVYKKGMIQGLVETKKIIITLRRKKYDLAIFGHRNSMFPLITLLGGIKQRIGFTGTKMLTCSVPFNEKLHETERYLSILKLINVRYKESETILSTKAEDVVKAESVFKGLKLDRTRKYIGIFPGGGENPGTVMPIKRWYPEKYAELCNELFEKTGLSFIFMGDNRDKRINRQILSLMKKDVYAADTSGMTDIGGLCGLIEQCELFIGGDTGPVHMAAALGVPTVTIFGPSDPKLVAPRGKYHRYLWKGVYCSPCYNPISVLDRKNKVGNEFICRTGTHECLKELQVEEVLKEALEAIEEIRK